MWTALPCSQIEHEDPENGNLACLPGAEPAHGSQDFGVEEARPVLSCLRTESKLEY